MWYTHLVLYKIMSWFAVTVFYYSTLSWLVHIKHLKRPVRACSERQVYSSVKVYNWTKSAPQCHTVIRSGTVSHSSIQCDTAYHCAAQCYTVIRSGSVAHSSIQCDTAYHCVSLCSTVPHSATQWYAVALFHGVVFSGTQSHTKLHSVAQAWTSFWR